MFDTDGEEAFRRAAEQLLVGFLKRDWFIDRPKPTAAVIKVIDEYVTEALFYGIASHITSGSCEVKGTKQEKLLGMRDEMKDVAKRYGFDGAMFDQLVIDIRTHWAKVREKYRELDQPSLQS